MNIQSPRPKAWEQNLQALDAVIRHYGYNDKHGQNFIDIEMIDKDGLLESYQEFRINLEDYLYSCLNAPCNR